MGSVEIKITLESVKPEEKARIVSCLNNALVDFYHDYQKKSGGLAPYREQWEVKTKSVSGGVGQVSDVSQGRLEV